MSLQQFPVLDKILSGEPCFHLKPGGEHALGDGATPWEKDQFLAARRVLLHDDQRIPFDYKAMLSAAQHMMLPFPRMWIEWRGISSALELDDPLGNPCGMLVSTVEDITSVRPALDTILKDTPNPRYSWAATGYFLNAAGSLTEMPIIPLFELDENGILDGMSQVTRPGGWAPHNEAESVNFMSNGIRFLWPGIVAIGWMNCKNVTTVEHAALNLSKIDRGRKGKKRARSGPSAIDFHTIKLPGHEPQIRRHTGRRTGPHAPPKLHAVRGHFKTFTPEAPLLGRAVGTFWWGWNMRGNPSRGQTITDYEMGK